MNSNLRKNILWVHRWTGLTVGLITIFLALTGLTMVFRPQLEPVVDPTMRIAPCGVPMALDSLIAKARALHAEAKPAEVKIVEGTDGLVIVSFTDKKEIYLNPCTGAILKQQRQWDGLFGTLEQLHRFRFIDAKTGNLITGTSALTMAFVLVIGGLIVWWPATRRAWKNSLKLLTHLKGRAFELNLHRTAGFYTSLVILFASLTSLPLALIWVRDSIYAVTGSTPAPTPKAHRGAPAADMQPLSTGALWERTLALYPDPSDATLAIPQKPGQPVEFYLIEHGAPHPEARSYVYFDPYSGEVLSNRPYATSGLGTKIYRWSASLHMGYIGGVFGQMLLFFGILGVPVLGYTGISSYLRGKFRTVTPAGTAHLTVKVAKKTVEATDICTFELADPAGKLLPSFSAGSHIDVHVRKGLSRQYSLCNDPKEKHRYLIGVLRDPNSRGGSATMHEEINEGDQIEISQPKNHFPLAHSAKRSLLFAGGIGITPILCMAERLANIGADFEMHYCSRSADRTAFIDRIRQSAYSSRVSFHFDDGASEQRLDFPALLANPEPNTHLYVCGPTGFMDFVIATAKQKGWHEDHIHREYFAAPVQSSEGDVAFEVKIASTGKVYQIAKGDPITRTLAKHGIDIPTSCEQGVCGTCVTRIIDGEPDHRDVYLTEEERARNDQFMPCCSRAKSPMLVLDL